MRSKNGSNVKHICLSKNEKRWQTKQEKMIKAQNEARSHTLNHSRSGQRQTLTSHMANILKGSTEDDVKNGICKKGELFSRCKLHSHLTFSQNWHAFGQLRFMNRL